MTTIRGALVLAASGALWSCVLGFDYGGYQRASGEGGSDASSGGSQSGGTAGAMTGGFAGSGASGGGGAAGGGAAGSAGVSGSGGTGTDAGTCSDHPDCPPGFSCSAPSCVDCDTCADWREGKPVGMACPDSCAPWTDLQDCCTNLCNSACAEPTDICLATKCLTGSMSPGCFACLEQECLNQLKACNQDLGHR